MEPIKLELTHERLEKAVKDALESTLKSDYSNPVKDAVSEAIKANKGVITEFVNNMISEILERKDFKEKMGEVLLQHMISSALKK